VPIAVESAARQVRQLTRNCQEFGVELLGMGDDRRGIVHIIGPELGLTQPGRTIVCGDSHTSTHGAFGALAFGIGTTEVGHVFATQCLLQRRPRTMAVDVTGRLGPGITAKDLVLAIIGRVGVNGGTGHVIEYLGSGVEALSMDERMTVCNMSIEAGARAGMVAPDDTTFEYLRGRPRAPAGDSWERAVADWRTLRTDPDAAFDRRVSHAADVVGVLVGDQDRIEGGRVEADALAARHHLAHGETAIDQDPGPAGLHDGGVATAAAAQQRESEERRRAHDESGGPISSPTRAKEIPFCRINTPMAITAPTSSATLRLPMNSANRAAWANAASPPNSAINP